MSYLGWIQGPLGLALGVAVIAALLRGSYKTYPPALVYAVAFVLSGSSQMLAVLDQGFYSQQLKGFYWLTNVVMQLSILSLIVYLIHCAADGDRRIQAQARILALLSVAALVISLGVHHGHKLNMWMTKFSRDISFLAALLNLILWSTLLRSRRKNRQMLLVSAGLGVSVACDAIGHSLRQIARDLVFTGNLFLFFGTIIMLAIWLRAFQSPVPSLRPVALPHRVPAGESLALLNDEEPVGRHRP